MTARIIALPELPQTVLAPHVPYLEIHVRKGDGRHILAYGGDGLEFWGGRGGEVEGFDLFVKGGFAGVVEAEEEDRVFCGLLVKGRDELGVRKADLLCW
jgi:hypothetical protein